MVIRSSLAKDPQGAAATKFQRRDVFPKFCFRTAQENHHHTSIQIRGPHLSTEILAKQLADRNRHHAKQKLGRAMC
jgi:hypothetical protein